MQNYVQMELFPQDVPQVAVGSLTAHSAVSSGSQGSAARLGPGGREKDGRQLNLEDIQGGTHGWACVAGLPSS